MHIWDLTKQSLSQSLKGHLTACTCVVGDTIGGTTLVTGSDDTNAKVWDLRMKSN